MKLVLLSKEHVGKTLAMPIYNENGLIFINKGKKLTERIITKIQNIGIASFYIEDNSTDFILEECLPSNLKNQLVKQTKAFLTESFKQQHINQSAVLQIIDTLIDNLVLSENAILINNIALDDTLTKLSIQMIHQTIYAIILGLSLGLPTHRLKELAIASFLHTLNEYENVNQPHTKVTHSWIKNSTTFTATISTSVLFACETVDGKGPFHKKGSEIYEYAKMIKIAHDYTSFLLAGDLPHDCLEELMAGAGTLYDLEYVKKFAQNVYCYPNGLPVVLSTGQKGVVIKQNKAFPARPIIFTDNHKIVNLEEELTIFINQVAL